MSTFDRTGVYHSELVRKTDAGPLTVMFTGQPRDSKFPDKPRWVGFLVSNDPTKYVLNIENEDVEASIAPIPLDTWVYMQAAGSRDTATVFFTDNAGPILPGAPIAPVAGVEPPTAPFSPTGQVTIRTDTDPMKRLTDDYYLCLVAAKAATDRYHAEFGVNPDEDTRRTAITLFIQSH